MSDFTNITAAATKLNFGKYMQVQPLGVALRSYPSNKLPYGAGPHDALTRLRASKGMLQLSSRGDGRGVREFLALQNRTRRSAANYLTLLQLTAENAKQHEEVKT